MYPRSVRIPFFNHLRIEEDRKKSLMREAGSEEQNRTVSWYWAYGINFVPDILGWKRFVDDLMCILDTM